MVTIKTRVKAIKYITMIIFQKAVLNHLPCFGKVEFVSYNLSQFHYFSIPVNYNQLIFKVFTKFKINMWSCIISQGILCQCDPK